MREIIRAVQDLRKEAGYEVSDHIHLLVQTQGELEAAVTEHADTIKKKRLLKNFAKRKPEWDIEKDFEIESMSAKLALRK
jgi:hypothetical protein